MGIPEPGEDFIVKSPANQTFVIDIRAGPMN